LYIDGLIVAVCVSLGGVHYSSAHVIDS
jgi:hypothetical protein